MRLGARAGTREIEVTLGRDDAKRFARNARRRSIDRKGSRKN